ncbi:phosphotransferase family protein [Paenibacillus xylanexedens]|uniref:phosphotransferase family protein n=1 Tax=Paenibacillus xylanexedens TaxID=528191 RepID=UPI0011A2116C|nr:aminoglycoside phosphotransferase family protein [Paenibacillus xylanexedens]
MRLLGQGNTADVYEYSPTQIMKLYKMGYPLDAVQRELRITKLVREKGLNVPQVGALVKKEGRHGIVFERIEGSTMLLLMIQQPDLMDELSTRLARCHYDLHALDDHERTLPVQKEILVGAIQRAPLLSDQDKERIIQYLANLPVRQQICHGDFHHDNVIFSEAKDQLWLIDWMTGMSGDPAGDVARSWVILMSGSLPEDVDPTMKLGFETSRNTLVDRYIQQYLLISGLSWEDVDTWILPVAAARLDEQLSEREAERVMTFIHDRILLLN